MELKLTGHLIIHKHKEQAMKNTLLTLLLLAIGWSFSPAQVIIDDFDASDAGLYQVSIEAPPSRIDLSTNTTDKMQGTGALDAMAVIGAFHQWGSYAQLIYRTDSTDVLDWSIVGDSLSIWIKVKTPPTHPEYMVFRIHIADQPTPEDAIEEYIYENTTILDAQHDWVQLKIPFFERAQNEAGDLIPDSTGFILAPTTWGGFNYNNRTLDRDKIVGYNIGMITTGWDPSNNLPADSIEVSFDAFERFGIRVVPFVFFNGQAVVGPLQQFTWGQSTLEVEEGTGATPGTNSLKWTQGDEWANGWTGAGWNITSPYNMSGAWNVDSLKFKMKAPTGTGELRVQFESGADGKVGHLFTPTDDDQWHEYAFPLRDFVPQEGTTNFDSSSVSVFQIMAEATGVAGRVIYLDDIWTGNPVIDVVAPPPPANLSVVTGSFVNTILWDDVPNESGETYTIYYATHQITDINAPDVEVVTSDILKIGEGVGLMDHLLFAPATDQSVSYYYAMTCTDDNGNVSDVSQNSALVTNTAKGVSPISPVAPTNFAADGDLSDWNGITPFKIFVSDGGHIVTNTTIDDDADLSVFAYVAMDNDYLYVAFDVTDDVVYVDTTDGETYWYDSPDLYIGLYNWHGAPHSSYKRGSEPDYHIRFAQHTALIDNLGGYRLLEHGDTDYYWQEKFQPGYVVEAKIPLADMAAAGSDDLFTPHVGMRIPIDFSINDNDNPNTPKDREGILTYSPYNEDNSYQHPYRWVNTWIGDQWTGIEDNVNEVLTYNLDQNYPNPFNPTTLIQYSLQQSGTVTLKVYDMLGREVTTLVNEAQNAGRHVVEFNARSLASGVYLYRLESGSFVQVRKMLLLK